MQHCKPCKTPCSPSIRLNAHEGPISLIQLLTKVLLVLSIIWLLLSLRYCLRFINYVSSCKLHWCSPCCRKTCSSLFECHGVTFLPRKLKPTAFTDIDWVGDPNDLCSTMGFLIYLGRTPITWFALKKCIVSRFSMEVESQALTTTDVEVCLLHMLHKAFDIFLHYPPQLWCDNFFASGLASNPVFHA